MSWIGRLLLVTLFTVTTATWHSGALGDEGAKGGIVDGFAVNHLPSGIGSSVSDFSYEWGGVAFSSRVWERDLGEEGHRVDLSVAVLRGERLRDLAGLRDFLAEYHERDLATWRLTPFSHGSDPGLITEGQAFWSVAPGLAVSVRLDPARFDLPELTATALGVVPTA
ncbi:hypothetical protein SAMN02745673_02971 [Marinactinospora thermotolerans DSM 45154]|uniref:Uncharacterized protein n=1 Tax=Marinactinospora thermotolerans DSM 45154 TaxID=1122192 RepID=A0A1T4RTT8_9ACTN|nr:hypothetical protein [Marinactinospora thermotolerans]SKA19296.1 hypothetical protein SAMN02745673_02971 [Marinactinospora thermotolerans DSM 45154]